MFLRNHVDMLVHVATLTAAWVSKQLRQAFLSETAALTDDGG